MAVTFNTNPVPEVSGTAYDVQPLNKDKKEVEKPKDEYILMPANPQIRGGRAGNAQPCCAICAHGNCAEGNGCVGKDVVCGQKDTCNGEGNCIENSCGRDGTEKPCDADGGQCDANVQPR